MGLRKFSGEQREQGNTQLYSGNKATLVNILREYGNEPNLGGGGGGGGGTECGDFENTFWTIRPLPPVQTQISLHIHMSMNNMTFTLTVLYDGKINK